MNKKFDVVILGGGTSGCACAYECAKLGLHTLLLEKSECLGGAMTAGLVVPMMKTGDNLVNTDFYSNLIFEMKNYGAQIDFQGNSGWFNPEILKIVLDKMLTQAGTEILFNSIITDIDIHERSIKSISIPTLFEYSDLIYADNKFVKNDKILSECIATKYIVDATGNSNFSKQIGCEIINDKGKKQPMSMRFIMSGVDLKTFGDWLLQIDNDRDTTPVEQIDGLTHLSTAYTWDSSNNWALAKYFDTAVENNDLKDSDRNYFQVFSIAGMPDSLAFNCPRIVQNLDSEDIKDRTKALISGREAILRIANFCKKYLKGFENSYISNISDMLGVRCSTRVLGKYLYTADDIKNGTKFDNPALISDYPIDVHSSEKDNSNLIKTGRYQLPIESLMSANYDNLFIIGRGVSADFMAQGALRVQANCFSMGEAVAKHIKSIV